MATKSALQSKGVWGGAIAALTGAWSFLHSINVVGLAQAFVDNWPALTACFGGMLGAWGRIRANTFIKPAAPAAAARTASIVILFCVLPFAGCTDSQLVAYNQKKAAITAALSTPQAKAIEAFGETIAQAAISVYAPEFAWTLPLALNTASGLLADQTTAQSVATIQDAVKTVSGIPQYTGVATQIGNAITAIAPQNEAQRVAAAQALALAIAEHLPKS